MIRMLTGDCRDVLATLPNGSVHCCVTSPPYFGLRDYGMAGQIGLEPTPAEYVAELVAVLRDVRRVLCDDGTLWLNLGDSYATSPAGNRTPSGISQRGPKRISTALDRYNPTDKTKLGTTKPKDLLGIPWMVAFALRDDGWWLRQDIIWSKPNPMPESVTDRCTKAHEYLFLLSKSARYWFDPEAIAEPAITAGETKTGLGSSKAFDPVFQRNMPVGVRVVGETRNKRSVWEVATQPFAEAHFATFPPALIEPCILAGCPAGGTVLDPFAGAGTTGLVADRLQRDAVLIELNPAYREIADTRIRDDAPLFAAVANA